MKALILSAGFGSRLGSLTKSTPKALLKVGSITVLDHNIEKLLYAGIDEILINTHYLASQVNEHIRAQSYSKNLTIRFEPNLLGTAGTVKWNWKFFDNEDFLVMHGDNFFEASLVPLIEAHNNRDSRAVLTMGTFTTDAPEKTGTVVTDSLGIVEEFYEKKRDSPSKIGNSAIYVLSPSLEPVFTLLEGDYCDMSLDVLPKLIGRIQSHFLPGQFIDIGSPEGLLKAEALAIKMQRK